MCTVSNLAANKKDEQGNGRPYHLLELNLHWPLCVQLKVEQSLDQREKGRTPSDQTPGKAGA